MKLLLPRRIKKHPIKLQKLEIQQFLKYLKINPVLAEKWDEMAIFFKLAMKNTKVQTLILSCERKGALDAHVRLALTSKEL